MDNRPQIIDRYKSSPKLERRKKPHMAIVTMKIDVRAMEPDGTFDIYVMGQKELQKYGMTTKAQISINAPSEAECIKKLKQLLERLND
tara:strand:+ start:184 stop:447 length:264 start_codon:yes stop_codon:yes gene_type:complete